jgi:hypothetical protein
MGILRDTYYQCDVCEKISPWTENHKHIERPVGYGHESWEMSFITCSEKCRNHSKMKPAFIHWLSKFPRWGKKSALKNFEVVFE